MSRRNSALKSRPIATLLSVAVASYAKDQTPLQKVMTLVGKRSGVRIGGDKYRLELYEHLKKCSHNLLSEM